MSWKHLGETFDIHGGGIDLVFPHHENEIAQSRCAFHSNVMANFWMHNGFLQVEGEKMAKSAGNFVTIRELLTEWKGYGWPGEALRLNMLRTHYRQPIDWTEESLDDAHRTLWDWYGDLEGLQTSNVASAEALSYLCDDLNTPQVLAELHRLKRQKNFQSLLATLQILGFSGKRENIPRIASAVGHAGGRATTKVVGASVGLPAVNFEFKAHLPSVSATPLSKSEIEALIAERNQARNAKNFTEADRIRNYLLEKSVVLKDTKDGTTWEVAR
jgi:cysteinyl-tRNA synthetase